MATVFSANTTRHSSLHPPLERLSRRLIPSVVAVHECRDSVKEVFQNASRTDRCNKQNSERPSIVPKQKLHDAQNKQRSAKMRKVARQGKGDAMMSTKTL